MLDRIQYASIRFALGFRKSTPIRVLHAESGEAPLSIRSHYLTCRYIVKMCAVFDNSLFEVLEKLLDSTRNHDKYKVRSKFQILSAYIKIYLKKKKKKKIIYKSDIVVPYNFDYGSATYIPNIDLENGFTIKHSVYPNSEFNRIFMNELNSHYNFYTDASTSESNYVSFAIFSSDWTNDLIIQKKKKLLLIVPFLQLKLLLFIIQLKLFLITI